MFKRNRIAAALMVVLGAALLSSVAASEQSGVPASSSYDDLLGLFHEFREFQQPAATDSVPEKDGVALLDVHGHPARKAFLHVPRAQSVK